MRIGRVHLKAIDRLRCAMTSWPQGGGLLADLQCHQYMVSENKGTFDMNSEVELWARAGRINLGLRLTSAKSIGLSRHAFSCLTEHRHSYDGGHQQCGMLSPRLCGSRSPARAGVEHAELRGERRAESLAASADFADGVGGSACRPSVVLQPPRSCS